MSDNRIWQKLPCLVCFVTVLLVIALFYQRALAQESVSESSFKVVSLNCALSEHCADIDIKQSRGVGKIVSDDEYNGFTLMIADNILDDLSSEEMHMIFGQEDTRYAIGVNLEDNTVAIAQTQKEADLLAKHPREVFYALKGQTLKQTIERWLSYQGVKLIWEASVDYKLVASAVFEGKLFAADGALNNLLKAFEEADHPLQAQLKANNVLVIKAKSYSSNMVVMQND
ncbi:TcpQ domain-containing protein [Cysteiniphilum sp. 6C5]|uniref:TcpQ domain-containing protein n=1 Tax=unclassified Cysteiniphilum TaxID=2610889 RepID=UPI003F857ACF